LSQHNEEVPGRRSHSIQEDILGLREAFYSKHGRHVSAGDLLFDRWETAKFLGFGEGSSCYNNVLVIGDVTVGKNTWIGPNVILDGSGGLEIGDYVSISAGVQIYTHDSVDWSTSLGKASVRRMGTKLGNGVYIGPNSVVQMGTSIGDGAIIGAMSFINSDVPAGAKFFGIPGRSHS
jgi:acetyltransferase-like isoleucine patch superfamily enzyme